MQSDRSGIYKIENMLNGKCYVGSAVILKRRLNKLAKLQRIAPAGESYQK